MRLPVLRLPPLVRDLAIDYTGLSFVAPEKVAFFVTSWKAGIAIGRNVGNRRHAFYTNLAPGHYRFRVTACNNCGVWNEAGTFLDFSHGPGLLADHVVPAVVPGRLLRCCCGRCISCGCGKVGVAVRDDFGKRASASGMRIARGPTRYSAAKFSRTAAAVFNRWITCCRSGPPKPSERLQERDRSGGWKRLLRAAMPCRGLRSSTVETNDLAEAIGTPGKGTRGQRHRAECSRVFVWI